MRCWIGDWWREQWPIQRCSWKMRYMSIWMPQQWCLDQKGHSTVGRQNSWWCLCFHQLTWSSDVMISHGISCRQALPGRRKVVHGAGNQPVTCPRTLQVAECESQLFSDLFGVESVTGPWQEFWDSGILGMAGWGIKIQLALTGFISENPLNRGELMSIDPGCTISHLLFSGRTERPKWSEIENPTNSRNVLKFWAWLSWKHFRQTWRIWNDSLTRSDVGPSPKLVRKRMLKYVEGG